jgi:hypothetical protein
MTGAEIVSHLNLTGYGQIPPSMILAMKEVPVPHPHHLISRDSFPHPNRIPLTSHYAGPSQLSVASHQLHRDLLSAGGFAAATISSVMYATHSVAQAVQI